MSKYGWAYRMKEKKIPQSLRRQILSICKDRGISIRRMKLIFDEVYQLFPDPLNPRKPLGHRYELFIVERKNVK